MSGCSCSLFVVFFSNNIYFALLICTEHSFTNIELYTVYALQVQPCRALYDNSQRKNSTSTTQPRIFLYHHAATTFNDSPIGRSIDFLDINVSISDNRLSTSVHCKPTDSHSYLLHSSSHPTHVKNSIPYSQFLRLGRLCSDDTDFSEKAEEMCQFFKTRGYPDPIIHNSKHRAQSVHPQSAPLSSPNKLEGRIPLKLTFHPHNISVKHIILKKLLQHNPTTAAIFAQPLLISYKPDKNLSNLLAKSTLKSDHQPGTFK